MQSRPKRNSSSTQEKYFDSTLTFCFYRTLVRLLSTLVKNSLTDSFMCLRIKWCDPGDNYAKSKLVFIGSLMTASDVRRDSWRSLSFVICQVKSNSFNPCVCDNFFIVQDWSSGDCWPSVNKRNIFPFQLRYMTWMADEYKCQTKYQGTNISCIEFFLPFNKLLQSFQKYIHFFVTKSFLSTLKTLLQALHNVLDYVHLDSFLAITRLPCPDSRLSFKNLCSF